MECWYDSLFECDCVGIDEIIKVPCAGNVYTWANYRQPSGLITPGFVSLDPKLEKRIKWITSCAGVAAFYLIAFDDWKTKKWRVFIRIISIRVYPDPKRPWYWEILNLELHHCYYLGQYPWFWDFNYYCIRGVLGQTPIPPQTEAVRKYLTTEMKWVINPLTGRGEWVKDLGPLGEFAPARTYVYSPKVMVFGVETGGGAWVEKKNISPFGMTPTYPNVEYYGYENVPEEDKLFFLGGPIVYTWNEQLAVIDFINARFKRCIEKMYPPPEVIPRGTVKTKDGEFQWPGKPMDQIQLPLPQLPRAVSPTEVVTKISVLTTLSMSPAGRPDGLTLETTIY